MELGQSYHIYNHANGMENIFREEENYRFFLQQCAKYLAGVVDTYAYCLMPNHFHLLVGVKEEEQLKSTFPKFETLEKLISKQFANFFSSYTQSFNKVYDRKGSLFIKNFKRTPILDESQWQETFLYIHLNPVKHGFVKDHQDWKWSSWHAYQNLKKPSNLDREYFTNFFDGWEHVRNLMEMKKDWLMNKNLE
ncbi:transposase [Belliella baltica DSM 15883]|uniref:Transposase n=1 Tax=Belliella baltica (strain DSM 15883 / CIP 108006 / LMG 21964 / BA134) TaxID=866536 RepID=I3Z8Z4_BELBD|nr:transposase [Belliella baltica]AFL85712.1 transposase [Belliella baltica DSM 15883]